MAFRLLGLGTAVPPHRISQDDAAALARKVICRTDQQARVLTALYQKAGVQHRFTVLPPEIALNWLTAEGAGAGPTTGERMQFYAQHATQLAHQAANRAIENAAVDSRRITHLITISCTGFTAPGVDLDLIQSLHLRPTVGRIHVGFMGCHAAINGLRCAQALAKADAQAVVLLCAVELCSLHYRFHWDPPRMVANALFGDGAAAVVGVAASANDPDDWTLAATGSCLLPDSKDAMSWHVGDHGFEMTLAATVPDLIHTHLKTWLQAWLDEHGCSLAEIKSWAIHPGGPRILHACAEALELADNHVAVSNEVLAEFGNMSSPTVLFILERLRHRQAPRPCVSLAFGPGLAVEAALFR